MPCFRTCFASIFMALLATVALSENVSLVHGGDTYLSGGTITQSLDSTGDAFVSGRRIVTGGVSQGDLHVTGFDITINADTAQDLYAVGGTVVVRGKVSEDLTAAGFSLRTDPASETMGNARLIGNTITIEGPILGSLAAMGMDVIVNAPIKGDVRITANSLSFGSEAVIDGILTYSTEEKISVPERVAPDDRVIFEKLDLGDAWDEWEDVRKEMPVLPTFASMFFGFIVSLLFFVVLGALMLTFMPHRLERMRSSVAKAPGKSIVLGIVGLALLFGMVPITAMTIVGLPFVPIAILAIVLFWTLAYALGAYSIAMWVFAGLGGTKDPGAVVRLLVFAGAITLVALLNFIPFVGWVANYTLVLLGMGAMTNAIFQSLLGSPDVVLDVDMKPIKD
ncbi:hypothetical protein GV827_14610 [Sulfitobacter sp. JBTF-M27]|uniref:DUF8173 domain-containing protein n=1 Tax=Sulfitobacter sediminilitoris TaxID=2698830 RepID=A0A6P0CE52_9RHOB|nr:EI24 domain-containing protein [Sulfitobacter sediminilitoris]NEK23630.1 hypothetical protein [Sulfitobacter sediminilitoris]